MSWAPPTANLQGREQHWLQCVVSSHAAFCGCADPAGHFNRLFSGQPSGRPPTPTTPRPILPLPAPPAPEPPPRRGGDIEGDRGGDGGDAGGVYHEEELEELFAAAREDDM